MGIGVDDEPSVVVPSYAKSAQFPKLGLNDIDIVKAEKPSAVKSGSVKRPMSGASGPIVSGPDCFFACIAPGYAGERRPEQCAPAL